MPVRSLSSSVLRWPDRQTVDRAVREWIVVEARRHAGLCRVGYFGSYARNDWGVGSDLDLVAIVGESMEPFFRRALTWDLNSLPVPADMVVYTVDEWDRLRERGGRFARMLVEETVWIYQDNPDAKK